VPPQIDYAGMKWFKINNRLVRFILEANPEAFADRAPVPVRFEM
jgi:hypothetical protein